MLFFFVILIGAHVLYCSAFANYMYDNTVFLTTHFHLYLS